jgi:hypothetical protein
VLGVEAFDTQNPKGLTWPDIGEWDGRDERKVVDGVCFMDIGAGGTSELLAIHG